jgi:hypothetical protein
MSKRPGNNFQTVWHLRDSCDRIKPVVKSKRSGVKGWAVLTGQFPERLTHLLLLLQSIQSTNLTQRRDCKSRSLANRSAPRFVRNALK